MDFKPPRDREYYEALGRFIEEYAAIEHAVSAALWCYAKVSPTIARALFSGTRSEAAAGYIRRILDGTKARKAIKEEFEKVFIQLSHITEARNLIMHYETIFTPKRGWVVSNRRIALDRKRLKERPISVEILNQMSRDLDKMGGHLLLLVLRHEKAGRKALDNAKWAYQDELASPWLYKPPKPRRVRKRNRRGYPKQPRQLVPSRA